MEEFIEQKIKELTLMLLYLTSWTEKDSFGDEHIRAWKGYDFDILNLLSEEKLIQDLKGKSVGDRYTLNNVEYVVCLKDNNSVELISSTPLGSVTLGVDDKTVTGKSDVEKALNSYNNALNKIQLECENVTEFDLLPEEICSVRSVQAVYDTENSSNIYAGTFDMYGSCRDVLRRCITC